MSGAGQGTPAQAGPAEGEVSNYRMTKTVKDKYGKLIEVGRTDTETVLIPPPGMGALFFDDAQHLQAAIAAAAPAPAAPALNALRDFYWNHLETLESDKPGYSYISCADQDELERLFMAALPDSDGEPQPQAAPGPDAAMAALAKVAESHERVMYAALIDITHGDPNDAQLMLQEQLDGYDGPQWNGTETGAEWLERTDGETGQAGTGDT